MAGTSSLYGVIDIGSNSVRLAVFDTVQTPPLLIANEKTICGLARDLDRTGKLNPEGVTAALTGLVAYGDQVRRYDLAGLDVVATAALREAADGPDFIRRVADIAGLNIRLISGEQEARFAALGVRALNPRAEGVVADFGGGSLEFARLGAEGISDTLSRPFGAYRVMAMGRDAEEKLRSGLSELAPVYGNAPALHAIGGSWRSLAQGYAQENGKPDQYLQGYDIPADKMIAFCRDVASCSPLQLRHRFGFEENRSKLAPTSAFVFAMVLECLTPQRLVISLAGIRDGIVYDLLHATTKNSKNM